MKCFDCYEECAPRGEVMFPDGITYCYWCAFPRGVPKAQPPKDEVRDGSED